MGYFDSENTGGITTEYQGWTQRGCLRGGTSSQRLEPSGAGRGRGESMRGGEGGSLGGGVFGGAPPDFFLKSMSLRMHFKPFGSPLFHIL